MRLTAEGIFKGTSGIQTHSSSWFLPVFQSCFYIPGSVWVSLPTALPDAIIHELLMGVWWISGENFQSYKCEHPSYIDEMEEPMLDRKELIDFSGDGSILLFMLWWAWRLTANRTAKVQSGFWSWVPLPQLDLGSETERNGAKTCY